tara:strand:- start:689 stop:949 length:261 start_codon:yes stop_codon:yes gene_type:complete
MYTYYEVFAKPDARAELLRLGDFPADNDSEVMFGSYDRTDCTAEIDAERDTWKEQGYSKIRIQSRETEEAPDPEIYGAKNCKRWAH